MIKKQFALILILWCSFGYAQEVVVYSWEEVQTAHPDTIYAISFEKGKLTDLPSELAKFKQLKPSSKSFLTSLSLAAPPSCLANSKIQNLKPVK